MKKLIILLLISLSIGTKAQDLHFEVIKYGSKPMIGKTKDQVIEYWTDKVSSFNFTDLNKNEWMIMEEGSSKPEFYTKYEDGKCIEQSVLLLDKNVTVFETKIQKNGFVYNKAKDAYINKALGLAWSLMQEHSGNTAYGYWDATLKPYK